MSNPWHPDTFTVTMLGELRSRFEEWLTANNLWMGHVPDAPSDQFIVVPLELPAEFRCPRCGMVSHHPEDVRHRYCGNCHAFTDPRAPHTP